MAALDGVRSMAMPSVAVGPDRPGGGPQVPSAATAISPSRTPEVATNDGPGAGRRSHRTGYAQRGVPAARRQAAVEVDAGDASLAGQEEVVHGPQRRRERVADTVLTAAGHRVGLVQPDGDAGALGRRD